MKDIWDFIKRNKMIFLCLLGLLLFTYCYYFQNIISVDTEFYINDSSSLLKSWIALDRWGLVFLKQIGLLFPFHVLLTRILTIGIFYIALILYTYLFTKWVHIDNKWVFFLTFLTFATSPIFAEQFGFTLQSVEIALGLLLLAIDFCLIEKYLTNHNRKYFLVVLILTTFCFGLYQAFDFLFISITIFYILTHDKKALKKFILLFLISFGINYLISFFLKNNVYFISSSYLTNNFKWNKNDLLGDLYRIVQNLLTILLGRTYFHSITFGIFFTFIGISLIKKKNYENIFYLLCLFLSPFLLMLLTANTVVYRAQFSYIFVLTFLFLYSYSTCSLKKTIVMIFFLASAKSMIVTPSLFYQDSIRYQKDLELAAIVKSLVVSNQDKSLIFVGSYNSSTPIKGETLGYSFASWDVESEYGVNNRAFGFLKTQGIEPKFPSKDEYLEALKIDEHDYYPNPKGIIYTDKSVIIYLK